MNEYIESCLPDLPIPTEGIVNGWSFNVYRAENDFQAGLAYYEQTPEVLHWLNDLTECWGTDCNNVVWLNDNVNFQNAVYKSCSTSIGHATEQWDKTNCRGGIKQYSTRELAYKGLIQALKQRLQTRLGLIEKELEKD